MKQNKNKYKATAFISQSLRPEDKPFIDYAEKILKLYKIKPTGTVGKHSISPENPADSMKKNIKSTDFIVICATARYFQTDLHNGEKNNSLPEMIHAECGMAYMAKKPIVVFVQEGTDVGSFIPNITQYVTLKCDLSDYKEKKDQIYYLLNEAYKLVKKNKNRNTFKKLGIVALFIFAIYGIYMMYKKFKSNKNTKLRKLTRQEIR